MHKLEGFEFLKHCKLQFFRLLLIRNETKLGYDVRRVFVGFIIAELSCRDLQIDIKSHKSIGTSITIGFKLYIGGHKLPGRWRTRSDTRDDPTECHLSLVGKAGTCVTKQTCIRRFKSEDGREILLNLVISSCSVFGSVE